jgi:hypothetical protein
MKCRGSDWWPTAPGGQKSRMARAFEIRPSAPCAADPTTLASSGHPTAGIRPPLRRSTAQTQKAEVAAYSNWRWSEETRQVTRLTLSTSAFHQINDVARLSAPCPTWICAPQQRPRVFPILSGHFRPFPARFPRHHWGASFNRKLERTEPRTNTSDEHSAPFCRTYRMSARGRMGSPPPREL